MNLRIDFPDDLRTVAIMKCENIPCFCKVSGIVEISFEHVVTKPVEGVMEDCDALELSKRALCTGGSKYTQYCPGTVSLKKIESNLYKVTELSFFIRGWQKIIKQGVLVPLAYE